MPYSTNGIFSLLYFFGQVEGVYLSLLTAKINKDVNDSSASFQATKAYAITWSDSNDANLASILYQVVLCMDEKTNASFMIVSFAKLDAQPSAKTPFFWDPFNRKTEFNSSTNDSNCGIPGQFIFPLDPIKGIFKLKKENNMFRQLANFQSNLFCIHFQIKKFKKGQKYIMIQPCTALSIPQTVSLNKTGIKFVYLNIKVTLIEININGDLYLRNNFGISYHILPYYTGSNYFGTNSYNVLTEVGVLFYFIEVERADDLQTLTDWIKKAFNSSTSKLSINTAYSITWSMYNGASIVQVVLCMDQNNAESSFMVVSYPQYDRPSNKTPAFFYDPDLQENTFRPSANGSNCGVPGRFVFQLNSIYPQACMLNFVKKKTYIINKNSFFMIIFVFHIKMDILFGFVSTASKNVTSKEFKSDLIFVQFNL
jgi:hypothetical protein